jgi:hypothetical protein
MIRERLNTNDCVRSQHQEAEKMECYGKQADWQCGRISNVVSKESAKFCDVSCTLLKIYGSYQKLYATFFFGERIFSGDQYNCV